MQIQRVTAVSRGYRDRKMQGIKSKEQAILWAKAQNVLARKAKQANTVAVWENGKVVFSEYHSNTKVVA